MQSKKSDTATPFCKICYSDINESSFSSLMGFDLPVCGRCYRSFSPVWTRFFLDDVACYSLYPYNEAMKTIIFNLKACGDIELAPLLLAYARPYLKLRFRGYVLVPAPSFSGKNKDRGFNHVIEIFKVLGLPMINPIVKTDDIKQSSLNFRKRQLIENHLAYVGDELINQKVLIVDDICTTGATIKACAALVKKHGAKCVSGLVVTRTTFKVHDRKMDIKKEKCSTKPHQFLQKALIFWKKGNKH